MDGRTFIRKAYRLKGLCEASINLIVNSIAPSSWKQYEPVFTMWQDFCKMNEINPYSVDVSNVSKFLSNYFEAGRSYSCVNTARSALSLALADDAGNTVGSHPLVCRVIKGVAKTRPPNPRYDFTWDPEILLHYLRTLWPLSNLSLNELSIKTAALLSLTTAHRSQTLAAIKMNDIVVSDDKIQILVSDQLKTSRPGAKNPCLVLPRIVEDEKICPLVTLSFYMKTTSALRGNDPYLFISCTKPHKPIGSQTISRWVRQAMKQSGIDTNTFSSHSVRHSVTSSAKRGGITLDTIRKHAGWSSKSDVFTILLR